MLDAPCELVWEAWTDPKHLVLWWGPKGFTNTTQEIDIRPGGVWFFTMHGPDGREYPNKIVFHEMLKPERMTYSHAGDDSDPMQFSTTVTFEAQGNQTRLTMRAQFPSAAERDRVVKEYGAIEGGKQTLDRLAAQLVEMVTAGTADLDFVITRVFNAPRELVFKSFTDPQRMQHWWGPKGYSVLAAKMDLRPGGSYHYGMQGPDGGGMRSAAPSTLRMKACSKDGQGPWISSPTTWQRPEAEVAACRLLRHAHPVATAAFGHIHRLVGAFEQRLFILVAG